MNLRPETDPETEYVAFDRPRVLRVLARIIADLDFAVGPGRKSAVIIERAGEPNYRCR